MVTLDINPGQYKTYVLSDPIAKTCLEMVPERGGIITRWQVNGQDLLYLDGDRFANPSLSVRGGIPILFPICGNLPNNTYTHQGRTYTLKQHGFARDLPWTVSDSSPQDGITLTLKSNNQTYAIYPFDFELTFTYRLQGNALLIQQSYMNRSPEPMPFSTGLHPYFAVSDAASEKTQLQFDIPATQLTNQIDQTQHPFSGQFDFGQTEIDVAFRHVARQEASVTHSGHRLILSYDSIYANLVFWTIKGKDYYCLEPWSAPRNAMNTGEDLTVLEPGSTAETWVKLAVG
ncbi:MAG: aldose epimerase [Timaviella obliquedivisa GSE-PSE-MK23-08B]|jgi:galactose mutarotase-like enzyme|nr:aldose epimerase [Timaviella obliquedivisa GSE-PSE-MK23-08B]